MPNCSRSHRGSFAHETIHIKQDVQKAASGPCLRFAAVSTDGAILVGELCDSLPLGQPHVLLDTTEKALYLQASVLLARGKLPFCSRKVAQTPKPFRTYNEAEMGIDDNVLRQTTSV